MTKQQKNTTEAPRFPLGMENYRLIAIGFGIIIIGFILMIGGKNDDPEVFNYAIFNFQRVVLSPFLLLFGFVFQIYAIMKKPKSDKKDSR
ncbi:MAG: DUF3098 domain-containing protein [Prolixibacteraceae bacterium]|nr:DUF3098 domain-containing protein [Prolixibacteraceae bacterium]